VICYELLTGNRPFEAETLPQLCMEITHAEPKPLRVWRPDLPAAFEQLVQRCLEKDAKKRLSSVAELARELVNFAPKRSQLSAERIERMSRADGRVAQEPKAVISAPGIASASTRTAKRQTRGAFGHTESAPSTPRSRSLVVGIALLAAGGASVLLFTQQAPSNEPVIASMSITPEPAAASVFINKPPLPVEQPNAAASGLTAQSATAAASLPVAAASSPLQSISRKPPGVPQRQRQSLGVPPNSTPAKKAGASGAKPERGELGGRL
jgi:serine/threonine-protein kinase